MSEDLAANHLISVSVKLKSNITNTNKYYLLC